MQKEKAVKDEWNNEADGIWPQTSLIIWLFQTETIQLQFCIARIFASFFVPHSLKVQTQNANMFQNKMMLKVSNDLAISRETECIILVPDEHGL